MEGFPDELLDAFEPRERLGRGAAGTVFRARDRTLDRDVALKVSRTFPGSGASARFMREARALAGLRHPGVVEIYTFGVTEDHQVYLATEFLDGEDLSRARPLDDPLPPLLEVAAALDEVHAHGLVHRDVKPENIVLTRSGRAVLVDFGLVHDPQRTSLTRPGQVMGTFLFLAPEVLRGETATPAADWWGWGATLYEAAEGRPPFTAEQVLELLREGTVPPLGFQRVDPGGPLAARIRGTLVLDPEARLPALAAIEARGEVARAAESPAGRAGSGREFASAGEEPDPATVARQSPPGGTSGWRRGGLALGLVAIALAVGAFTERSRPQVPVPTQPALPRLEVEVAAAREELETEVERLAEVHGTRNRLVVLPGYPSERLQAETDHIRRHSFLLEEGDLRRLRRLLVAAADWLEAVADAETERRRRGRPGAWEEEGLQEDLDRLVVGPVHHLLLDSRFVADLSTMDVVVGDPFAILDARGGFHARFQASERAWVRFWERVRRRRDALPEDFVLALEGWMRAYLEPGNASAGDLLDRLEEDVTTFGPSRELARIAPALSAVIATSVSAAALPRDRRVRLVRLLDSRAREPGWPQVETPARLLLRSLIEEVRFFRFAPAPGGPASTERVAVLLEEVEEGMPLSSREVRGALELARRVATVGGVPFYEGAPPSELGPVVAWIDRLREGLGDRDDG